MRTCGRTPVFLPEWEFFRFLCGWGAARTAWSFPTVFYTIPGHSLVVSSVLHSGDDSLFPVLGGGHLVCKIPRLGALFSGRSLYLIVLFYALWLRRLSKSAVRSHSFMLRRCLCSPVAFGASMLFIYIIRNLVFYLTWYILEAIFVITHSFILIYMGQLIFSGYCI